MRLNREPNHACEGQRKHREGNRADVAVTVKMSLTGQIGLKFRFLGKP
jgi:hypothetical protein